MYSLLWNMLLLLKIGSTSCGGWANDDELQVRGDGEKGEEAVQGDCDGSNGQVGVGREDTGSSK